MIDWQTGIITSAPVLACRSLPAKSTMLSLPTRICASPAALSYQKYHIHYWKIKIYRLKIHWGSLHASQILWLWIAKNTLFYWKSIICKYKYNLIFYSSLILIYDALIIIWLNNILYLLLNTARIENTVTTLKYFYINVNWPNTKWDCLVMALFQWELGRGEGRGEEMERIWGEGRGEGFKAYYITDLWNTNLHSCIQSW